MRNLFLQCCQIFETCDCCSNNNISYMIKKLLARLFFSPKTGTVSSILSWKLSTLYCFSASLVGARSRDSVSTKLLTCSKKNEIEERKLARIVYFLEYNMHKHKLYDDYICCMWVLLSSNFKIDSLIEKCLTKFFFD